MSGGIAIGLWQPAQIIRRSGPFTGAGCPQLPQVVLNSKQPYRGIDRFPSLSHVGKTLVGRKTKRVPAAAGVILCLCAE